MRAFYENRTYNSEIHLSAFRAKNMNFVAHWHSELEILYVCEGRIGVGLNSEYRVLESGDISVCGSNDIHYYDSEGMTSNTLVIVFRPEILGSFSFRHGIPNPCSAFIDRAYRDNAKAAPGMSGDIKNALEKVITEMREEKELYPGFSRLEILRVFLLLFRHFPAYRADSQKAGGGNRMPADIGPMQKALKYIEDNYSQELSLERIAGEANLSRFYFSRLFRKTTGMNFNAYLARVRIEKAAELIGATGRTITEIAYETGFSSIRTFNRAFRGIMGCAPQSLRKTRSIGKNEVLTRSDAHF